MKRKIWLPLALAAVCIAGAALLFAFRPVPASKETPALPTVRILTLGECSDAALERVSAALSERTAAAVGCRVELCMVRPDEYDGRISDLLLENEFADIFVCRGRSTLSELMDGSYIYRLDRYLEDRPALLEAVPDAADWSAVQKNGYTYAIPFANGGTAAWGFVMRADEADALGIDAAGIRTLDALENVLLRVRDDRPELIPVVSDYGNMQTFGDHRLICGGAGCLETPEGAAVITELPEFAARCAVFRRWQEEGLIMQNAPFNKAGCAEWLGSGLAFGAFVRLDALTLRSLEYEAGTALVCAELAEPYWAENGEELSFGVYAYAEDPALCLRVLELIYTDPETRRMCVYGEEKADYILAADGAALPLTDVQGGRYVSWCWPLRAELPAPMRAVETALAGENVRRSTVYFDTAAVRSEAYQCGEIAEKYFEALCAGMLDPEEGIARMDTELQSAGVAAVREELDRQIAGGG